MSDAGTPVIEIAGLEKRYGDTVAVDGVTLGVTAGEVFGLLGPNGAGKTTTVEVLEGYRRADGGTVRVLGLDPGRDGRKLRPRIGVMLQDGGLYPGIRPLEAVELFASYYEDADDPARLLARVGLDDARGTLVRRLSGGQYQRLSLALALVGKPELVFLDEPTAGLDPHGRAMTWELVRELRAEHGTTVVLTTHSMDEAEQLCDRVAIVDHGRLVASGTPAELTAASGDDAIRFSSRPGLDCSALATVLQVPVSDVVETGTGRYVLRGAGSPDTLASLTAWLRDHDAAVHELTVGGDRQSLEEVFLRLTSEGLTSEGRTSEGRS